jgi:hypothetical protein
MPFSNLCERSLIEPCLKIGSNPESTKKGPLYHACGLWTKALRSGTIEGEIALGP